MASASETAPITEWPREFTTRGGIKVRYLGVCPNSGRHRIGQPCSRNPDWTWVWTLNDAGICRCDGQPGEHDYVPAGAA